jgi:tetratricopeptide (TPR) repeat protein
MVRSCENHQRTFHSGIEIIMTELLLHRVRGAASALVSLIALSCFVVSCNRQPVTEQTGGIEGMLPDLSPRPGELKPSAEFLTLQQELAQVRAEIIQKPEVVKNYVAAAQIYLREERISGEHHLYMKTASRLIDESLKRDPDNYEAIVTKGSMLMTLHKFSEAREVIRRAIARYPESAIAYGVLCDADVEMGEYDQAVQACDKMLSLRPDLRSYARASYLRELHGDIDGSVEVMVRAIDAGVPGSEERSWAMYQFGNLLVNQGKLDSAEYVYRAIEEERPGYYFTQNGLAVVQALRGDRNSAIAILEAARLKGSDHVFLENLADFYRAEHRDDSAKAAEQNVLRDFAHHESQGWNVDREYAMFCSNHGINLQEALKRAKRDYERRPENVDALDAYAWALHVNGNSSEAVPYMEKALRLGSQSPSLSIRAGIVFYGAGDNRRAMDYLQSSELRGTVIPVLYQDAVRSTLNELSGTSGTHKTSKKVG